MGTLAHGCRKQRCLICRSAGPAESLRPRRGKLVYLFIVNSVTVLMFSGPGPLAAWFRSPHLPPHAKLASRTRLVTGAVCCDNGHGMCPADGGPGGSPS